MALSSFKVAACAALALAVLVNGAAAFAADGTPASKITLAHTPAKAETLPFPGTMIPMRVSLENTRDSDRKLRGFFSIDGRLLDIDLEGARFSDREEPTYEFQIPAPIAQVSYQFVLYNADHTFTLSPRYVVKRSCMPDITLAEDEIDEKLKSDKKIIALIESSKGLERDIQSYEHVLKLLGEIKGLLGTE